MPPVSKALLWAALGLLPACTEYNVKGEDPVSDGADDTAAAAAALQLDPPEIDFGAVAVGTDATSVVTATNVGDAPLTLVSVALAGTSDSAFSVALEDGPGLPAGASADILVTYAPLALGTWTDTLAVSSDAPTNGSGTVALTGGTPMPALSISPTTWDFGTLDVGASDGVDVVVTNNGAGEGSITSATFTSNSDPELAVSDWSDLSSGALTLAPGASVTVHVAYVPADESPDEGTLLLETDDPSAPELSAAFTGDGHIPAISYGVNVTLTADDAWEGWADGVSIGGGGGWDTSEVVPLTWTTGTHVLAIHAYDEAMAISGFLAEVDISGYGTWLTGGPGWRVVESAPDASWTSTGYDDSAWSTPLVCPAADVATWWGGSPADLIGAGALWIWSHNCTDLGEGYFRLELTLP